jgi:hypothetical protein
LFAIVKAIACIKIDKQPLLISLWVSVKHSTDRQGLFVYLNTGDGFDNGKQWQANLGDNWKNRPTHENGENSMLIDINGDGLPDRV